MALICRVLHIARSEERGNSPAGMDCFGRLHSVALGQTNVHQYQIGSTVVSKSDRFIRGHGNTHHGVPGRFEISLGAQGDDRLIFDYEDTHNIRDRSGSPMQISQDGTTTVRTERVSSSSDAPEIFFGNAQTDAPYMPSGVFRY